MNFSEGTRWPKPPGIPDMTFAAADCKGVIFHHDDPLVVVLSMANLEVHQVLVDDGSSTNILFGAAFEKFLISPDRLKKENYL